jgi:hypothetical protein
LIKLNELISDEEAPRKNGIEENVLGKLLFAERFSEIRREYSDVLFDAGFDLYKAGLVVNPAEKVSWRLTRDGRKAVIDMLPLWESICSIELDSELQTILSFINSRSPKDGDTFARVVFIDTDDILKELSAGMSFVELSEALREL